MNQEQVKGKLLKLESKVEDFTLLFSGKASKKVDGLYHPDKQEIIIHNKNFMDDNPLIYTAIHEFAHHIQYTTSSLPISARAHTNRFWDIFHKLLRSAEQMNIYNNIFKTNNEILDLTKRIKDDFLIKNANLMKDFGKLLHEAYELCIKNNASFDDYVDRELLLHHNTAKALIKISGMDINPKIGFDNMKTVASIKDDAVRELAESAFLEGKSPDMVKAEFASPQRVDDALGQLLDERDRLERSLENLTVKLAKVERRIGELKH